MASSISGAGGGMSPIRGLGGNGDDKKTEKKATMVTGAGDHTVSQSRRGQGGHTGDKVKALKEKLSLQAEKSVQSQGSSVNIRELRNMPAGTVKQMAANIEAKLVLVNKKEVPGEVSVVDTLRRGTEALEMSFKNVQEVCEEAKPLPENTPQSVKEKARKTWSIIKEKLADALTGVRKLIQIIKALLSSLAPTREAREHRENLRLYRVCQKILANKELEKFVDMNTGEVVCDVPKDLEKRVEQLQADIKDLIKNRSKED